MIIQWRLNLDRTLGYLVMHMFRISIFKWEILHFSYCSNSFSLNTSVNWTYIKILWRFYYCYPKLWALLNFSGFWSSDKHSGLAFPPFQFLTICELKQESLPGPLTIPATQFSSIARNSNKFQQEHFWQPNCFLSSDLENPVSAY